MCSIKKQQNRSCYTVFPVSQLLALQPDMLVLKAWQALTLLFCGVHSTCSSLPHFCHLEKTHTWMWIHRDLISHLWIKKLVIGHHLTDVQKTPKCSVTLIRTKRKKIQCRNPSVTNCKGPMRWHGWGGPWLPPGECNLDPGAAFHWGQAGKPWSQQDLPDPRPSLSPQRKPWTWL